MNAQPYQFDKGLHQSEEESLTAMLEVGESFDVQQDLFEGVRTVLDVLVREETVEGLLA